MRKTVIALAALLLMSLAAPAWAQTKPGSSASSVPGAPGSEPAQPPDAGPNLFPGDVHVTVNGDSVDRAPAGGAARITVEVFNGGPDTVRDVTAHIRAVEGGTVGDADSAVADISPNASEPARFTITANESNCQDFAAFLITFTYAGGSNESKFGVPVACPGPRLSIENVRFAGGDGDGVPEPGEKIRAFVVLRNEGRDPATNVTAHVTVSGKGLTTTSEDLSWNDIAAGTTGESATPIVIDIPDDAPRQDPCPGPIFGVPPSGAVVSSDDSSGVSGTTSSGNVSSPSTGAPEPAPSESPNGVVEIQPAETGTVTPEPAPAGSVEPAPAPGTPEPLPAPAQTDQPVGMEMQVAVKATGYSETLGYGNGIACAVEALPATGAAPPQGAPAPVAEKATDARLAGSVRAAGTAGLPIALAVAVSIVAIAARRLLVG